MKASFNGSCGGGEIVDTVKSGYPLYPYPRSSFPPTHPNPHHPITAPPSPTPALTPPHPHPTSPPFYPTPLTPSPLTLPPQPLNPTQHQHPDPKLTHIPRHSPSTHKTHPSSTTTPPPPAHTNTTQHHHPRPPIPSCVCVCVCVCVVLNVASLPHTIAYAYIHYYHLMTSPSAPHCTRQDMFSHHLIWSAH